MSEKQLIQAVRYEPVFRTWVEKFRKQTVEEGNDALPIEKFDPDNIDGTTWCAFVDGELAALMVLENDHYATKDISVARACRFHTLKKYRNKSLGGKYLLPKLIEDAKEQQYSCVYWTHDIANRGLNAIYQKRFLPMRGRENYKNSLWSSIQLDRRWLFQVDKKSDLLQYVYYIDLNGTGFMMNPINCVVWQEHDGRIIENGNKT